jgi:hypothetical protein
LRRAARLADGWIAAQAYSEQDAWHYLGLMKEHLASEGRSDDDFTIYMALNELPDVDLYRRFEDAGVTDLICAPWMIAATSPGRDYTSALDAKLQATEQFADRVIRKMA